MIAKEYKHVIRIDMRGQIIIKRNIQICYALYFCFRGRQISNKNTDIIFYCQKDAIYHQELNGIYITL